MQDPETDFDFLKGIIDSEESPVHTPHALTFSLQDDYVGAGEVRFKENAHFLVLAAQRYPALTSKLEKEVWDTFFPAGHKVGGYAYFTQNDPREYNKAYRDFILLFQLDSDQKIMWGDVGVANFCMDPAALARKDFSQVLYNWDCH